MRLGSQPVQERARPRAFLGTHHGSRARLTAPVRKGIAFGGDALEEAILVMKPAQGFPQVSCGGEPEARHEVHTLDH